MQAIVDFFASIWSFFTGLIDNLFLVIKYIGAVSTLSKELILSMPSWLQVFGFITLTVSVLYLLLGRTTGGQKE